MFTPGAHIVPTVFGAALLLAFTACNSSSSSAAKGTVTGAATAVGGAALDEYVTLSFTAMSTSAVTTVDTQPDGTYTVELVPDTYDVVAARPGYDDVTQSGLVVADGGSDTVDVVLPPKGPNEYIGSVQCGVCHDDVYQTFAQTGHPYKLNKVNGAAPIYPFTSLEGIEQLIADDDTAAGDPKAGTDNTLGTPAGWDDITYVIGGFHWKARFMDADGFIVTGSEVQYNYATNAMSAYHDNETDKPFNCGNCHTTGWQHYDATVNNNRQDGLAGIDGTFAEQGIGCEACHGAGSLHAQTSLASDTTRFASPRTTADFMDGSYAFGKPVACSECHTRDGERDYPSYMSAFDNARIAASMPVLAEGGRINTSGGLVRHHEQYDEVLGIDPDTLESTRTPAFLNVHGNCLACHDVHKAAVARNQPGVMAGVDSSNNSCLQCHDPEFYDPQNNLRGVNSMRNLNCVDCHMPKTAKSATARTQPNGLLEGDVASHVFSIQLDQPQFTMDGKHSYPYLSTDFACRNCHGDETFDIMPPLVNFNYHPDKP